MLFTCACELMHVVFKGEGIRKRQKLSVNEYLAIRSIILDESFQIRDVL